MPGPGTLVVLLAVVTLILVVALAFRPDLARNGGGRIFAFLVLLMLPVFGGFLAGWRHLDHSTSTSFCLSCHIMEPYGASLESETPSLAAAHYQNNRVPRDEACYSCHTDYTMYGDLAAKWRGLQHVWVYYVGGAPEPQDIQLYVPYRNRECLHCHEGARSFEELPLHAGDIREALATNELSCLDCHAVAHDPESLSAELVR